MTNLDDLNLLVSEAIRRAELLDDLRSPTAPQAWTELSLIEEKLARHYLAETAEGAVARRGAIHAAIQAQDLDRAEALILEFSAEGAVSARLVAPLQKLLDEQWDAIGRRFPFAARKHGISEVRKWAKLVAERRGKPLMVA